MDFILDPGLVLYLPFYELDGPSLMSKDAYGHLATVTGATWGTQGRSFDGTDDFINLGTPAQFKWGTSDFTLLVWGKHNGTGDAPFASKGYYQVGYNGNWVLRSHSTQGLQFFIFDGQSVGSTDLIWAGFTSIRTNWNHIVIRRLAGSLSMIVNGDTKATLTYAGNIGNNTYDFWLGKNPLGELLGGLEGEVLIYSRALTHQEIQRNYLATKWRYV